MPNDHDTKPSFEHDDDDDDHTAVPPVLAAPLRPPPPEPETVPATVPEASPLKPGRLGYMATPVAKG